jgi:demethylmenaquinone methyltransferase/2-methoxy-6-polyprenyl-1,4-benzoquinol methylase
MTATQSSPPTSDPLGSDTSSDATESGVDKSGHRVRDMFAQIAPRYDLMNHVLSLNIDRLWRRKTVQKLDLSGSEPVVDACTGTGDLAIAMAKLVDGRARVVGTDFCNEMLDIARLKQMKAALATERVEFIEADTQDLPFDDNSCQAVTVAFGLRNVQDTMRGLIEMTRICKPSGQVAVLEFSKPTLPGLRQLYSAYFKHVLPRIGQAVARNEQSAYEYLPNSVAEFPCGQDLADMMERAGLEKVEFWPMTFGVATLYIGRKK